MGGAVFSSASVTAQTGVGTDIFTFKFDYTGNFPSSLQYRFNNTSGDAGDMISLESVRVNGISVDAGDISAIILARGQTSTQNMTNTDHLFGRVEPTQADLGAATVSGVGIFPSYRYGTLSTETR